MKHSFNSVDADDVLVVVTGSAGLASVKSGQQHGDGIVTLADGVLQFFDGLFKFCNSGNVLLMLLS
jgi:hypothetical protein